MISPAVTGLRIAVGQADCNAEPALVLGRAVELLDEAGRAGARVLLLSELYLFGYDVAAVSADERRTVRPEDPRLNPLRAACVSNGIDLFVGVAAPAARTGTETGTEQRANAVLRITANGSVSVVYRKVHLWASERAVFTPGETGAVVDIDGVRVGIGICYDAGFPEYVRALVTAGAELVLFSSAFATGDEERRYDIYHVARALESGVWVAVSNTLGTLGESTFFGRSVIVDPFGHPVAALRDEPGIIVHDVVRHRVAEARRDLPYLTDLAEPYRIERA